MRKCQSIIGETLESLRNKYFPIFMNGQEAVKYNTMRLNYKKSLIEVNDQLFLF
jgi:hypothetical protein